MTTISVSGTVEITQPDSNSQNFYYSANGESAISFTFPATIVNTDTNRFLLVTFGSSIILEGNDKYFICGSSKIQFEREKYYDQSTYFFHNIAIKNANNYLGLIRNGSDVSDGYNDIKIYNLSISTNTATLGENGGWVVGPYFGKNAANNYIITCFIIGSGTETNTGGIAGSHCASGSNSTLYIIGCFYIGTIGQYSGGICGPYAGENYGTVFISSSFVIASTSTGVGSGGLFGAYAADDYGNIFVVDCYGQFANSIGTAAGGIFGLFATGNNGSITISNTYTIASSISQSAGGIFGGSAATGAGTINISNCFSGGGSLSSSIAGGIFGANANRITVTVNNLYSYYTTTFGLGGIFAGDPVDPTGCFSEIANGSNSGFSQTNAQSTLSGGYLYYAINTPPILAHGWVSPYSDTVNIIDDTLSTSFNVVGVPGSTINPIPLFSNDYSINSVTPSSGQSYFQINNSTGQLSISSDIIPGVYTVKIINITPIPFGFFYSVTSYKFTVAGQSPSLEVSKKELVPDFSVYLSKKKTNIGSQTRNAESSNKFRAPLQYTYYSPFYKTNIEN